MIKCTAVLKKVRYALCPMPYALCPIVPHLSEKGYINIFAQLLKRYEVRRAKNPSAFIC
jgi:hypothetical protein